MGRKSSRSVVSNATRRDRPALDRPLRLSVRTLEDRRDFHPERDFRPALSLSRLARRLVPVRSKVYKRSEALTSRMMFAVPKKVAKCVRRKERREVMFASKKSGKGARQRVRRRDYWSDVKC